MNETKLTQYSHGAGCGCKIAPAVLDKILQTNSQFTNHPNLLVGNSSKDDAAVYDLGNGNARDGDRQNDRRGHADDEAFHACPPGFNGVD